MFQYFREPDSISWAVSILHVCVSSFHAASLSIMEMLCDYRLVHYALQLVCLCAPASYSTHRAEYLDGPCLLFKTHGMLVDNSLAKECASTRIGVVLFSAMPVSSARSDQNVTCSRFLCLSSAPKATRASGVAISCGPEGTTLPQR